MDVANNVHSFMVEICLFSG